MLYFVQELNMFAIEEALSAAGFETRLTGRKLDKLEYKKDGKWLPAPRSLAAVAALSR